MYIGSVPVPASKFQENIPLEEIYIGCLFPKFQNNAHWKNQLLICNSFIHDNDRGLQ